LRPLNTLPAPVAPAEIQDPGAIGYGPAALEDALAAARQFALAEKAESTRRAYAADFRDFARWCDAVGQMALPALSPTVAAYIAQLADRKLKASTITRRLAAIRHAHKLRGHEPPTASEVVKSVSRGIRRRLGTRPDQKAPATAKAIASMIKRIPAQTLAGKRDRALLLIGFAGALRRSELVALDLDDVVRVGEGALLRIRKSKTDQEGRGAEVPIPHGSKLRPLEALDLWTTAAGITEGALFRRVRKGDRLTSERLTDRAVALIVKRWAEAARLDPAAFSGHSLRAGFVTSALEAGADVFAAADQGRWRKLETVREYDRRAKLFVKHAGKGFL
jgi:site-specific recombinase XerD